MKLAQNYILRQVNKYWKNVIYKINNIVWLFSENIDIKQLFKSLINKILKLFKVLTYYNYLYRLNLPEFIKKL